MAQAHAVSFQANTATLIPSTIKYFTVVGQMAKNGLYTYPYTMTLAQHGNAVVAIELSIDTQAHTQLIAVGTPTTQALLQHDEMHRHQGTSKQQSTLSSNNSTSSNVVPFTSGTHSVKYTIDWYDPVGIEVNALTDYLTFSYNGNTTTYISGSDSRWWLSDDGWVEQSHGIYGWNYWGGNVRTYVYTDDTFANTPFCAGQTTYVYDTQNTAEGLSDGSVMGFVDFTYAADGCSALLHYSSWLN